MCSAEVMLIGTRRLTDSDPCAQSFEIAGAPERRGAVVYRRPRTARLDGTTDLSNLKWTVDADVVDSLDLYEEPARLLGF